MRDPALDPQVSPFSRPLQQTNGRSRAPEVAPASRRRLEPMEFAGWLDERLDRLGERWLREVRTRAPAWDDELETLLGDFFEIMLRLLPATLGPYREQVEPLWVQAAELFGSTSAQRGLAAGEVIEEFQILREGIIRLLYAEPPVAGGARMSLRDILRINRVVDRGVTHASVGHTDALFFSLFQGSGVPDSLDEEVVREVRSQLDGIRTAFGEIEAAAAS